MTRHPLNGPLPAGDCLDLLNEWRQAVREEIAALEACKASAPPSEDLDARREAARERLRAIADKAWARPSLGMPWNGFRLRAEIVRHLLWPDYRGQGVRTLEDLLGGKEAKGLEVSPFNQRAVAELVRAVLSTAGAGPARPRPARDWLALPAASATTRAAGCDDDCVDPLECLVERARLGLTAVRTLWNAHASVSDTSPDGEDFAFGASMTFVVDEIEAILDRIAATAHTPA